MGKQVEHTNNKKIIIKEWNFSTEVVDYKDIVIIAIDNELTEDERLLDLHWALEKLEG